MWCSNSTPRGAPHKGKQKRSMRKLTNLHVHRSTIQTAKGGNTPNAHSLRNGWTQCRLSTQWVLCSREQESDKADRLGSCHLTWKKSPTPKATWCVIRFTKGSRKSPPLKRERSGCGVPDFLLGVRSPSGLGNVFCKKMEAMPSQYCRFT